MRKYLFSIGTTLLIFLSAADVQAQKTARFTDPARDFREALEIYDQLKYNIAYERFVQFINEYEAVEEGTSGLLLADAYYYKASCAAAQKDPKTEQFYLAYLDRFKGHSLNNRAYFDLGNWYFNERQYNAALDYYNRVEEKGLNRRYYDAWSFRRGFCYFSIKQFDSARKLWSDVIRDPSGEFYAESNYYYGLAAYYDGDYAEAEQAFRKVENESRYRQVIPYYITQMTFLQDDYQGVIDYAIPVLDGRSLRYKPEIHQLVGQSWFELGEFNKAADHLSSYVAGARSVTKEDYYQLGYSEYQSGRYADAVEHFKELNHLNDALAQNALFLTGKAYIELGDRENARTALQRAASFKFDPVIKEEASFQYARLSYELGFTNEALVSLRDFIRDYPQSEHQEEANEILADLLLQTRNYDEALAIIEQMPSPSAQIREAYQIMAYHKAISLYNDGRLNTALEAFNKAERYTPDKSLLALTRYWRGDIFYRKGQYQKSIAEVAQFLAWGQTPDPAYSQKVNAATANYLQGYNYYKLNDYEKAGTFFEKASDQLAAHPADEVRSRLLPDALLRSADCAFLRKNYSKALSYYDQVIGKAYEGADYAYYQKAIVAGLQGRYREKISDLATLRRSFPQSVLADDALFETGKTYILLEDNDKAVGQFETLIRTYGGSEWVAPSYLQLGLIYFNSDRYDEALAQYKKVVAQFPRTTSSAEALLAIRDVYIAKGDPQGYIAYIEQVPGSGVSVSEQDSLLYLSAENLFTRGSYDQALKGFNDYLLRFPGGFFSLSAHYYRAECHFSFEDFEKAIIDYEFVLDQPRSRFTERSLQRSAGINYYHLHRYDKALDQYLELMRQATTDENRRAATLGILRSRFRLADYPGTIEYAARVIGDNVFSGQQQSEAYFYRARAYWEMNQRPKAVEDFRVVRERVTNEWAAEATYSIALDQFERGEIDEAETTCFEFIRTYPSYATWLVRTYVLLADVYIERDNLFQAKATVQSVLDNYRKDDEWRQLALDKYNEIEALEAGRSKIIDPADQGDILQFDEQ